MIIKKYQAANEADAIILAKEELGKNVIIMNVKRINPKGVARLFKKSKVEVTAAIDDEKSYSKDEDSKQVAQTKLAKKDKTNKNKTKKLDNQINEASKKEEVKKENNKKELSNEEKNKLKESYDDKHKEDLKEELIKVLEKKQADMLKQYESINNSKKENVIKEDVVGIKKLLQDEENINNKTIRKKQIISEKEIQNKKEELVKIQNSVKEESSSSQSDLKEEKSDKYVKLIKKQLLKHEVDEKYIDMIINEVKGNIKKDTLVDNILTSVYQKIILKLGTPKLIEPGDNQPRYVFFMGPTGVGKTTTIAKIASDFKLNRKLNIALLTSDTYRIAAVEQLRIYANILKVPLNVAYNAEDIRKLKKDLDRYDVVLIDTAGRSHKNKEQSDDLRELISTIDKEERDIYLVLSATTKYSDLVNIVQAYGDIEDYKLLFTKTDETTHLGNILNIKLFTNARLSYIANGQDVPTDIGKVDAQEIAKQLLGGGV